MVRYLSCIKTQLILLVKSIQARKILLNYVQEMVEGLGPDHKFKALEILVKIESDGFFGHEWLDLFQRIVLLSSGNPLFSFTVDRGIDPNRLENEPEDF